LINDIQTKLHTKERKKVTEAYFRNWHFKGKVDADGRTTDKSALEAAKWHSGAKN
jgi:hypothetical protein